MHTRELVESIANARKAAETIPVDSFRKLSERIFYVPLQTVRNSNDPGGGKKVRFLVLDRSAGRVVPAFSTEDLLFEWSQGGYQFLPIAGADLVLALPEGLFIELDPDTSHQVVLFDDDLETILSQDQIPSSEPQERRRELEEEDGVPATVLVNGAEEGIAATVTPIRLPTAAEVEARLTQVLEHYPAVLEAYYLGSEEGVFGGLLGLLVGESKEGRRWDTEQRFGLVESIAELARELYGYAGAIEVYDDLENEASRSWDLFKGQSLFYRQEKAEETVAEETNEADEPEASRPSGPGSWLRPAGSLRKKGAGVIGVVPGLRLRLNEKK